MTDSEDIAALRQELAALKEEVAALTAWRTRTPVLKRLEDDTDHSFNYRRRLAEKIIREGREAEYILWMREDIKSGVIQSDAPAKCSGYAACFSRPFQ